jgi:hypothetical protein
MRASPALALAFATLVLSACPKQEWHYAPPPAPAPARNFDAQFDATHLDPNGAARNVDWHPQLSGHLPDPDACNSGQPYSSACTQDPIFQDQPDIAHEAFCFIGKATSGSPIKPFFGHSDWMVAQFNGSVGWFNYGDDWDYGLFLIPGSDNLPPAPPAPLNAHGITTNNNHVADDSHNPQYIEMEFDSTETDPAFTKGWWNDFKLKGHANDDPQALADLLHPNQKTLACGSFVGLFGLDCDHGCRSELHPLYGVAIQRTEDPNDNEWSIMARNWGTGGYCSQYNDELAETSLSILLPYTSSQPPTNAQVSDFVPAASDSTASIGCPTIYFQNGQTILNLTLPPPEQQPVAAFSLKLQWPSGAQPVACTQPAPAPPAAMMLAEHATSPAALKGEEYMGTLLRSAAQSQNPNLKRPTLEHDILPNVPKSQSLMQSLKSMALAPQPQPCDGSIAIKSGLPQPTPPATVHRLNIEPHKRVRDDAIRNYICHGYRAKSFALPANTTQQDFDKACKGVK